MTVGVALAGATGNLGSDILKALLAAGFEVIILTWQGSKSADTLPAHSNPKIISIVYQDTKNLISALQGIDAVVSALAPLSLNVQKSLIDAALAAGVKRFIPSEFGADMTKPLNRQVPPLLGKLQTADNLKSMVLLNPGLTYTYAYNNLFLGWCIDVGHTVNVRNHTPTLLDGGNVPLSMTALATIAEAMVGIINNLDATKNRAVYFHGGAFTQIQLINTSRGIDD